MKRVIGSTYLEAKRIFDKGIEAFADRARDEYGEENVWTDNKSYILWFDGGCRICDAEILEKSMADEPKIYKGRAIDPLVFIETAAPFIDDPMDNDLIRFASRHNFLRNYMRAIEDARYNY